MTENRDFSKALVMRLIYTSTEALLVTSPLKGNFTHSVRVQL